jgi:putative hydrolase of the HAD superfamily
MHHHGRSPVIKAVVFDWGGTLSVFVQAELVDAWRLVARHLDASREDEITAHLMEVENEFWRTTATHQRSGTLADLVAAAAQALEVDVGEALLEEAAVRHLDAWTPHIRHDADAVATLAALRDRGLRIGMLSNTHWPRAFHERFLERDGLAELIDARFYTSEMPFQKPHPSAFRAALAGLGVDDPADAVFVGDRPWDDISGAQAVGMPAVVRPNPLITDDTPVDPDGVIHALPELLPLVDQWR